MAVGDDAAEAGLPLVPSTGEGGQVKYGAREINRTRDMIAILRRDVTPTYRITGWSTQGKPLDQNGQNNDIFLVIIDN